MISVFFYTVLQTFVIEGSSPSNMKSEVERVWAEISKYAKGSKREKKWIVKPRCLLTDFLVLFSCFDVTSLFDGLYI